MKKTVYLGLTVTLLLGIMYGCKQEPKPVAAQRPENTFAINGSVRQINIHPETPEFPQQPGQNEFTSYCAICHSLKYISMQPDFPRKTWEAEVTKMIVKYKAPIDSVTAVKIVDYLVKIKSKA